MAWSTAGTQSFNPLAGVYNTLSFNPATYSIPGLSYPSLVQNPLSLLPHNNSTQYTAVPNAKPITSFMFNSTVNGGTFKAEFPYINASTSSLSGINSTAQELSTTLLVGSAANPFNDIDAIYLIAPLGIIALILAFSLGRAYGSYKKQVAIDGPKINVNTDGLPEHEARFLEYYTWVPRRTPSRYANDDMHYMNEEYFWRFRQHEQRLRQCLKDFIDKHGQPSDGFFETIAKLAKGYGEISDRRNGHGNQRSIRAYSRQIENLIIEPRLLADPRIDPMLEIIIHMRGNSVPIKSFYDLYYRDDKDIAKVDISMDFLETIERILDNQKLLEGKNSYLFLGALADVVRRLSEQDNERTRMVRFTLLHIAGKIRHGVDTILSHIGPTFNTAEDREALKRVTSPESFYDATTRENAQRILDGYYERAV